MPQLQNQNASLKLYINKDKKEALNRLGMDIAEQLLEFRNAGKEVLFLSSGGSALGALDHIDMDALGSHVTISVMDERYDKTNRSSNFGALMKTNFYKNAVKKGCRFIDTTTQKDQSQQDLADHFEVELRRWKKLYPTGVVLATAGVGPDGHTMGIMPYPEDEALFTKMFSGEKWVVAYDAKEKNEHPFRITTSNTFLGEVDIIAVFMTGKKKAEAYTWMHTSGSIAEVPARMLIPHRGAIYVDNELAKKAGII